jgi:hypothetical protein
VETHLPSRKLPVDLDELAEIFDSNNPEITYFLDTESGQVVQVSVETRQQLESIYSEYVEDEEDLTETNLLVAFEDIALAEWERQELLSAHRVDTGSGTRYLRIPAAESRQGFRDMEDFIQTVQDPRLAMRLQQAINRRSPFRNFKEALNAYPAERERWLAYKNGRVKGRVVGWLADEGLEALEP